MPEPVSEVNLAEFGTYTMEFTRLSQVTGNPKYEKLAMDLTRAVLKQPTKIPGLYPTTWTVDPFEPIASSKEKGEKCTKHTKVHFYSLKR